MKNTGAVKMSSFQNAIKAIRQSDPRTWIAFIYGTQILGSLILSVMIGLKPEKIAFPVFILFIGMVSVLWFRSRFAVVSSLQRWFPAGIYMIFIFSLSQRSFDDVSLAFSSNSFHPPEYATLGIFLAWAWYPVLVERGLFPFASRIFSLGFLYGVSDELHQSFIPGRFPSIADLFLDLLGLCLGLSLFLMALGMIIWHKDR